MSKRPVYFVVETGSLAGGVRVIGEMANRLSRNGWQVYIYSVNPRSTISWFPLDSKVKWLSFFRRGTAQDYQQLTDVLKKQDGIKIATFWRTAPAVNEASKPGEGYYLAQDIETSYTSQPAIAQAVNKTYEYPLHIFTTSRWVEKQLSDRGIASSWVGIGLSSSLRPPKRDERDGRIIAVARRQALKGFSKLMEVNRRLIAIDKHITTFGMDDGVGVLVPTEHIGRVRDSKGVRLLSDEEVRRLYQYSSIFVSTSAHEGFNLTALEAMACGCRVVKTHDDGSDEYTEHMVNCLVSDDPQGIAEHCNLLLRDKPLYNKLREGGIATAARYRWNDVIDRLETVLQS